MGYSCGYTACRSRTSPLTIVVTVYLTWHHIPEFVGKPTVAQLIRSHAGYNLRRAFAPFFKRGTTAMMTTDANHAYAIAETASHSAKRIVGTKERSVVRYPSKTRQ